MIYKAVIFLMATAISTKSMASEKLAIEVHSSILEQAIPIGSDNIVTPINRYLNGVYTLGSAFTTTNIQQGLSPMIGAAALQLTVLSHTNSSTNSQTWPRPRILIDFDAYSDTSATAWKTIYLTEAGFSQSSTSVSANSNITFTDLQSSSWGLFWRLKSRIAYNAAQRELMNQKATQEAQLSTEVARELASTIDGRTNGLLSDLQSFYVEKIYKPFIVAGNLAGKLQFRTGSDRVAVGTDGNEVSMPVSRDNPVSIDIGYALATKIISEKLNARKFSGAEILSSLLGDKIPDAVRDALDIAKLEATIWKFREQASFVVSSDSSKPKIVMSFAQLSVGSEIVSDVSVEIPVLIEEDEGKFLLDLDSKIVAKRLGGAALSAAENILVQAAIRNVIPPVSVELGGMPINIGKLSLVIANLALTQDGIEVNLSTQKSVETQNNADQSSNDISGWCSAVGSTWRLDGGIGFCDCGSNWIREDAMRLFGKEEFSNRCR